MQIVSQKVSTIHSSMAIKYSKIRCFFPINTMLWFGNIKYDCDSIFIILSDWALIGRGRVGLNVSIAIFGVFCRLKVGNGYYSFG